MCIRDSFTRAWIEIALNVRKQRERDVALFTRAWIEMQRFARKAVLMKVALFTRAWIEITHLVKSAKEAQGRPLHEGVD